MLLVLWLPLQMSAQYAVDWKVVSGGGGTSSGDRYTVQGTIGQPATGTQVGGQYTLTAGYWSLVTIVPTPGAPALRLVWDPPSTGWRLSWPRPSDGWVLQETDALAGPNTQWFNIEGPYETTATDLEMPVTASGGQRFYRLGK